MKTYGAEQKNYLVQEVQAKKPAGVIVSGCEKSIIVEELADMLSQNGMDIGVIRLYQWLREHGYVYRLPGGRNMPTKKVWNSVCWKYANGSTTMPAERNIQHPLWW